MNSISNDQNKKLKRLYWWGLLGIIPNFGFVGGVVLLYKGLITYKDKKLILIALGCVSFTPLFWYGILHSSLFKDAQVIMAQNMVNSIVPDIEFYKTQNNVYPDSLLQTAAKNKMIIYFDPLLPDSIGSAKQGMLHYKRIRDKYTLFSVGKDGIAGTSDDIYPTITKGDTIKFGFVKK
jgi:hypothetical protein